MSQLCWHGGPVETKGRNFLAKPTGEIMVRINKNPTLVFHDAPGKTTHVGAAQTIQTVEYFGVNGPEKVKFELK